MLRLLVTDIPGLGAFPEISQGRSNWYFNNRRGEVVATHQFVVVLNDLFVALAEVLVGVLWTKRKAHFTYLSYMWVHTRSPHWTDINKFKTSVNKSPVNDLTSQSLHLRYRSWIVNCSRNTIRSCTSVRCTFENRYLSALFINCIYLWDKMTSEWLM